MASETVKWISFAKPRPDLPCGLPAGLTIEHLERNGLIVGWRPIRVISAVAEANLANPTIFCRLSTPDEIAAELAREEASRAEARMAQQALEAKAEAPAPAGDVAQLREDLEALQHEFAELRREMKALKTTQNPLEFGGPEQQGLAAADPQ
jgi:hypothetical protein